MFIENTLYEILTPHGWKDFKGIQYNGNKKTITLRSGDNLASATAEHCFFISGNKIQTKDIKIGDYIDGTSGNILIDDIIYNNPVAVYDIIEVDHPSHQFIVNDCFITKNCDEMAFVLPTIANSMWTSISPTLATGGKAIITSTPNTDEDLFATIWREATNKFDEFGNEREVGSNGFYAYSAHWSEHPERDEEWAASEQAKIGEAMFRREYCNEFVTYEETLINPTFLSDMVGINPMLNMGQSRWYKQPTKDNIYLVSLDPSLGTGGNSAGIQVFELPSMEQVAEWHHNLTPIQGQIKILREILNYIKDCIGIENASSIYWSLENNTVGEAGLVCIKDIGEENFPGMFICEPIRKGHVRKFRKGFNTTHRSKITAASRMKYLIESKKMKIHSKPLISELKTYIATGVSFKAKSGSEDDLVSALLLIVRMSQVLADWDPRVFEMMSVSDSINEEDMEYPMPIYISSYG